MLLAEGCWKTFDELNLQHFALHAAIAVADHGTGRKDLVRALFYLDEKYNLVCFNINL